MKLFKVYINLGCGEHEHGLVRADSEEEALEKLLDSPSLGGYDKYRYSISEVEWEGDTAYIG